MSRLLQDLVTTCADERPEAPAVVHRGEATSYGELEALSNRAARALRESGCRPGDRIALLMPKSSVALAAILAVYKAGGILVPLAPAGPASRLERIVRSCGCRMALAAGPVLELLGSETLRRQLSIGWLGGGPLPDEPLQFHFTWEDVLGQSAAPLRGRRGSGDPAHILYTSGSTGEPKGVVITHSNVLAFVDWAGRRYAFGPDDRFSGHSPLHFDLSTYDIFGAFAAGASLYLVPPELNLQPSRLARFIRDSGLTEWLSVPSVLNYMSQAGVVQQGDFPTLRRLFWCGEVFPTPALVHWMERLPHVAFTNLYGPTETTIASSYYDLPGIPESESSMIPIGVPCEGEELLVLDGERRPLPPGATGELYIRGMGVSPGYWNDPERTRAAFFDDGRGPLYDTGDLARLGQNGLFYFLGRADSQIKSRGYRVELAEVETAVSTLGISEECAVTAIETDGFEGKLICCAYVPRDGRTEPAELKKRLRSILPAYMLPVRWMALQRLPRNASGKVDRRRLRERFEAEDARGTRRREAG